MSIQIEILKKEISVARRELKNIRQEVLKLKAQFESESVGIKKLLSEPHLEKVKGNVLKGEPDNGLNMVPIGVISSCFKNKNGIPRQANLCQSSKATLEINKTFFTNPEHSLIGLENFSFIWILFVFHKNNPESSVKAKVHPPRLNGASVGVFSTRSPHRPCPIGLSLVKLDKKIGNKLFLSGVDLLDGTPVLDIKPYINFYDMPEFFKEEENMECKASFPVENEKSLPDYASSEKSLHQIKFPDSAVSPSPEELSFDLCNTDCIVKNKNSPMTFLSGIKRQLNVSSSAMNDTDSILVQNMETKLVGDSGFNINKDLKLPDLEEDAANMPNTCQEDLLNVPLNKLTVIFTTRAQTDVEKFHAPRHHANCDYCLDFIGGFPDARQAIVEVLQNDPRSVYRRNKCSDRLYFFEIDKMHVTCWFDSMTAEVLRIKPIS